MSATSVAKIRVENKQLTEFCVRHIKRVNKLPFGDVGLYDAALTTAQIRADHWTGGTFPVVATDVGATGNVASLSFIGGWVTRIGDCFMGSMRFAFAQTATSVGPQGVFIFSVPFPSILSQVSTGPQAETFLGSGACHGYLNPPLSAPHPAHHCRVFVDRGIGFPGPTVMRIALDMANTTTAIDSAVVEFAFTALLGHSYKQ